MAARATGVFNASTTRTSRIRRQGAAEGSRAGNKLVHDCVSPLGRGHPIQLSPQRRLSIGFGRSVLRNFNPGTAKRSKRYRALSLHKTVWRAEPLGRKTLFVECDYMIKLVRIPLLCGALICSLTGVASAQSYPTLRPPRGAVPLLDSCNGMSGYPDCHPDRIYEGGSVAIRGIHLFPPGTQFYPAYRR
jgi:hypothetical protein